MAIQFARIAITGRSSGGNACCKGAYNARSTVQDLSTNITYNFQSRGDNVYHAILIPEYANERFKSLECFVNEVEKCERRKDSQLFKDIVLALPDDKELTLEDRIEITHRLIAKRNWVKEGLGVQVDIHQPHDGEKNWHAHLLVTTRRFTEDGMTFGIKATDLNPQFGKVDFKAYAVPEEQQIHEELRDIINDYFSELGLANRVDMISLCPHEHIGPVRMRNVMNAASIRNEERRVFEIEYLSNGSGVRTEAEVGTSVLNKVTNYMSVFTKEDLARAVKCIPDSEVRTRLIEEALANKSVISLYNEDGNKTNYYSTKEVRKEEEKIMRLSGYVANTNNVIITQNLSFLQQTKMLLEQAKERLTGEQHQALTELILSKSGLGILRGRAGSGKSYVLKELASINSRMNIHVIGLAPTHGAKLELESAGFKNTDTIKGALFKLANGRFNLPRNSLIVVDEAGMVGNDDFKELFRVAATRECNMILSGDERQLASVQRGGMFEIASNRYGSSTILNIKRQDSDWGKSVAMALSNGNVKTAIGILEQENRIKWDIDANESMKHLLANWHSSKYAIEDKLILAIKNSDVAALNHGARQYLKSVGKLTGEEISVLGNHYMQGDRILISKTNKDLGLVKGDIGIITSLSKDEFRVKMLGSKGDKSNEDNKGKANKEVIFNPSKYYGFRHGYATTIFQAQGVSIAEVYMFHNGFAGIKNSYVALSRNIIELILYANKKATFDQELLIKQLAQDVYAGSSLSYFTEQDLYDRQNLKEMQLKKDSGINNSLVSRFNKLLDFVGNVVTKAADKYIPAAEYYNYQVPKDKIEAVSRVIDKIYDEKEQKNRVEYGDYAEIALRTDLSTKKSTNAPKTDFVGNNLYQKQKKEWDREYAQLKAELKFKAELVTRDLLGEPNKRLSNGKELRYGDRGKITVRISGEKAGTWYDFSRGEGGDLIALYNDQRGGGFRLAVEYLREIVGMSSYGSNLQLVNLVHTHRYTDRIVESIKSKELEQSALQKKQAVAKTLYARAKAITKESVVYKYLSKTRSIEVNVGVDTNVGLGPDIKTAGIYSQEQKCYLPALIAFTRDQDGNITGGQYLLLDKKTGGKAFVPIPKRSFGVIGGAFVNLGIVRGKSSNKQDTAANLMNTEGKITIIAEGLETGLSIKQALSKDKDLENNSWSQANVTNATSTTNITIKILCSLGISNIKNYQPSKWEQIIIAADNDGKDSVTNKTIERTKLALEKKGAFVTIVKPKKEGDYNDILKSEGSEVVAQDFKQALAKHLTRKIILSEQELDKELKSMDFDLAEISKLGIKNSNSSNSKNNFNKNDLFNKVKHMSYEEKALYGNKLLAYHASLYFSSELSHHAQEKNSSVNFNKFMQAIEKEQKTLLRLYKDHKFAAQAIDQHCPGKYKMLSLTSSAHEVNNIGGMQKVTKTFEYAIKHKIIDQQNIESALQHNGGNLKHVYSMIDKKCVVHQNSLLKTQKKSIKNLDQDKQKDMKIEIKI